MAERRDPMVAVAQAIVSVQGAAIDHAGTRATVGRIEAIPGGTNVIASTVHAWLDARAETDDETHLLVADIERRALQAAADNGCSATLTEESWAGAVHFHPGLRERFALALGQIPQLSSGAGHDAGVLAAYVPSAMLFVRNQTGISHAPEEFADVDDCVAGIDALEQLLRDLL